VAFAVAVAASSSLIPRWSSASLVTNVALRDMSGIEDFLGGEMRWQLRGLAQALVLLLVMIAVCGALGVVFRPLARLAGLVTVPVVLLFLIWFYRARLNADQSGWRQRWSPGWAVGAWFTPVCLLWFPYQIMADIWRAGLPAAERPQRAVVPGAWWACWCAAWLTSVLRVHHTQSLGLGMTKTSTSLDISLYSTVPSLVFAAAAAVLLAVIVRRITLGPVDAPPPVPAALAG
jgi:Domain of unknown function (DUF4328)